MTTTPSPWPHRAALTLVCATLFLIFAGGLVTSTHSGLTVPDWPLSYGRLMPPMIGGIFFEHGHRMAATAVGILTIILNVVFRFSEDRPWVRRAGLIALGLVILQGLFGGLTVLLKLPKPVSIIHACLAQSFFCLTMALALWTSPLWRRGAAGPAGLPRRPEPREGPDASVIPLPHLALLLFLSLFAQLVLGALVRHTGHGVELHILNAVFIVGWTGWIFRRLADLPNEKALWRTATALIAAMAVQIGLGVAAFFQLTTSTWADHPVAAVAWATAHVMVGALVLGLSFIFLLLAWRGAPVSLGRFKDFVTLTKPGISFMAAVTALAGFLLGAVGNWELARLIHTAVGTLFVSGGACALNMLIERDVDARMRRTESRPLPARRLNPGEALLAGALLAAGGLLYLSVFVNLLAAVVAALTLSVYLYVYTPLKKVSSLNTFFGAVAGALPPVLGWAAATGELTAGAGVLFAILFFWQYPHFFALAWLYREDYARAGLHMLPPCEENGDVTARQIVTTSFALMSVSLLPTFLGMAGRGYFAFAFVLGLAFLGLGFLFFRARTADQARRLFLGSVVYLPLLLIALVLDHAL